MATELHLSPVISSQPMQDSGLMNRHDRKNDLHFTVTPYLSLLMEKDKNNLEILQFYSTFGCLGEGEDFNATSYNSRFVRLMLCSPEGRRNMWVAETSNSKQFNFIAFAQSSDTS
jgi:hypothetical protein